MVTPKKLRNGKWQLRWRDVIGRGASKSKHREITTTTRRQAYEWARDIERHQKAGEVWEPPWARPQHLIGDLAEDFVRDMARRTKASTARTRAKQLEVFLQFLDDTRQRTEHPVGLLTQRLLTEYAEALPHGGQRSKRSTVTVNKYLNAVMKMWEWAGNHDEWGEVVPRPRRIELRSVPLRRTMAPTFAQGAAMIAGVPDDDWHRHLYLTLYATGARVSQAMGFLWSDIDLKSGTLTYRPELGKTLSEQMGRTVPLPSWFVDEVAGWGARVGHLIECPHEHRDPRSRAAAGWWRKAGVDKETAPDGHHSFRAMVKTGCSAARVHRESIEYYIGHSLGLAGRYTAEHGLHLDDVANAIPDPRRVLAVDFTKKRRA